MRRRVELGSELRSHDSRGRNREFSRLRKRTGPSARARQRAQAPLDPHFYAELFFSFGESCFVLRRRMQTLYTRAVSKENRSF